MAIPEPAWRRNVALRRLSRVVAVLLCVLLVALFARTVRVAVSAPPSFDGAMNLQVAASIAAGEGYRRNYASREAFPHEIQTGPPFILPQAAVFKAWGVGIPQSEVTNIAYLALLLAAACWLIAPLAGWPIALFGACSILLVPGVHAYGLYGYGETPALAWVLVATFVYFYAKQGAWLGLVAGVMLACAVYTKTVMLIGAGALSLCAFLDMLREWRDDRVTRRRFFAFISGGALVIAAMEIWRARALGGLHAWRFWWHVEVGGIFKQAGVTAGLRGATHSLLDILQVHFSLLAHDYRMSLFVTGIWLALVFGAFVLALSRGRHGRRIEWASLAILLIALAYLVWWLLVTPTAKAWHRRILDGMICADLGLVMVVGALLRERLAVATVASRSWLLVVLLVTALALPAVWVAKGTYTLLAAPVTEKACALSMKDATSCARFHPEASVGALQRVVRSVRALPPDAYVFGFGWYSAPRVGLLAQRHILDFHDISVAAMRPSMPAYFVQGSDTPPGDLQRIRDLYGVAKTPDYSYALIHVRSLVPTPLRPGKAPVLRYIEAADNYAYLRGVNDSEGSNGRWLTDDNQVLLTPRDGDVFELVVNVLPIDRYEGHRAPDIVVSFDGCTAPAQPARPNRIDHLFFAIPVRCGVRMGEPVSVRIQVNNLVNSSITADPRALSVLAQSFGFVASPSRSPVDPP